ncbi:Bug family tripartite tricarboxylate transporter substrate binding protein [Bordetella bronchialis]|uniref:Bug family tripartite tricarboxylate transporter substrate binding protein n=1 Tax=Bordetella bronchialis TaxID=463025 RepID=UPI003D03C601
MKLVRTTARIAARAGLALALGLGAHVAHAQADYPNHKVRVIAPQGAGGGVDVVGRLLMEQLSKRLGQSFYIENQGGAGGIIGASDTARAAPDGYTLMIAYVATHGTNPAVRKTPYDPVKSFTPIAMIGGTANMLLVGPNLGVKTLKEFVDYARQNPDKLSYGTSGNGTLNHLAMEEFKHAAGFNDLSVPYKSMSEALTDVIGGRVQTVFPGVAAGLPTVKSGRVIPLAVTGEKRQAVLPDVPTFQELGYPSMQALTWYGVVGPARMPQAVTDKLNATVNDVLKSPDFRQKLAQLGIDPMPMSPAQFGDYIAKEVRTWTQVAHDSKISID